MNVKSFREMKKLRKKIAVITAYDYPFAKILDASGVDVILVGDSLGMTVLGYESTVPVTMREMIHHTKAVRRAVKNALLIGDMPFGSYDTPARALRNATRFMKEGGVEAIKLEGGFRVQKEVETLIRAGIPVMGHLGMTPQTAGSQGGYKVQGREPQAAKKIFEEAKLLDQLGVFGMVLECVPAALSKKITRAVKCPTIGIGAGPETDGQVLVLHDMLGFSGRVRPRFVRAYAQVEKVIHQAAKKYAEDVKAGKYPSSDESYQ